MVTSRYGLLSLMFLCGCPDRPDIDLDPPRIIGVEPAASPVPISVSFRLRFSEVINVKTVQRDDGAAVVVIVDRADATESFVSDLDNPPLSDSRLDALIPVSLVLEGAGAELVVVPVSPLLPGRAYTLLVSADVRDTSGNPLYGPSGANEAFRLDFTTDDGPPTLVYEDVSRGLVVPNRRYFHLAFDQPVRGLGGPTLALVGVDAAATAHPIPTEAVL
ncbi:MAG: Ig-like domain-containing protein, partial [Myxococcota bacterium]